MLACAVSAVAQSAPPPIGELVAAQASVQGSVVLAAGETSLLSGATVDAGAASAEIRLRRGGRLEVCPHTALTLNTIGFGSENHATPRFGGLMLSMGTGALELDYSLPAPASDSASASAPSPADSIVTPDFRLLVAAPATLHLAVSVDGAGDTCIRALAGNTANIMVGELMGADTYLVRPNDAVEFAGGNIANSRAPVAACGCAASATGTEMAVGAGAPSGAGSSAAQQKPPQPATSEQQQPANEDHALAPLAANVPAPKPNPAPVEVEAPFVFNAGTPALPVGAVAAIRPRSIQDYPSPKALPPPPAAPAGKPPSNRRRGFFSRVGGFFAHLFGGHRK